MNGIDVSKWQGNIDWAKVKASGNVDFAIIKAGYGRYASQIDPKFERNYKGCIDNGIHVGAYWFAYAKTPEDARKEARACLSVISGKKFDFPIWYDIEDSKTTVYTKMTTAQVSAIATAFCDEMEKAGYFCGVYSFKALLQSKLTSYVKSRYAIWLANVGVKATTYTSQHGIWQYSWTGRVSGISGDVDMNKCYIDYPTVIKNAGLNGYTKPMDVDRDGDVDADDANTVLEAYLHYIMDNGVLDNRMDADCDGDVDADDADLILREYLKSIMK